MRGFSKVLTMLCWMLAMMAANGVPAESMQQQTPQDDTMLMFVGEDIDVMTIASKREESARQAPAVAEVIQRKTIQDRASDTLSGILAQMPGFHMAQREWGTQPYLRGIVDSVLFLYDTVPVGSDVSKSLHFIDREMSMASIKRVEIIRGPGSVLWGPDAFAGIVNLVPLTGKDIEGVETGVSYAEPWNTQSFFLNAGQSGDYWDGILSVSGTKERNDTLSASVVRFWGQNNQDPVAPENRYGNDPLDDARYLEVSGRLARSDWFSLSGRIANNRSPYIASSTDGTLTWMESRENTHSLLKLEAKKDVSHLSALRFTGFYTNLRHEFQIIDESWKHDETTWYGEIIYDRSLMAGKGLFTGGVSLRHKRIHDAPIWQGYWPDMFDPANLTEFPIVSQLDYTTQLTSFFARYTHKLEKLDAWFGIRRDNHDRYQDHSSLNAGIAWFPSDAWVFKAIYGTAYRTPFARQLSEDETSELEKITSGNLEITWKPGHQFHLTLCGFASQIQNHFTESPYAGPSAPPQGSQLTNLSEPNEQNIYGVELEGKYTMNSQLEFSANLTLLGHDGPDESYLFNYITYFRPDGSMVRYYSELEYPYDRGPETLFNLIGTWKPDERLTAVATLGYVGSRYFSYPMDEFNDFVTLYSQGFWKLNLTATLHNFSGSGIDVTVAATNIFSEDSQTPGIYSMISEPPFSVEIKFQKTF